MKKRSLLMIYSLLGLSSVAMANTVVQQTVPQSPQTITMPTTQVTPQTVSQPVVVSPATQVAPQAVNTANQVNINTATAAEIQDKLIGIGAKKAQAIVDYRTKNGNFASIEQLTEVSGIGKATLEKNRDRLLLQ